MKVLVTGGTGFTGSHLVRRLLSRGYEVYVIDNQKGLFDKELLEKGAKITIGSVTDKKLLEGLVDGCEVIFHLAAAFRRVNLPKRIYNEVNVEGTRNLLSLAETHKVKKVIYCSTQGVHGNVANPPGDESSPIAPEDYYQYTKYKGEEVAQEYIARGMDITCLRPTAIYGPGDPGRFLMLFKRVQSGRFPFFGDGNALYHPLYIDNFIDAFELSMGKEGSKGQVYIIGDERFYTILDIVKEIAKIMNVDLKIQYYPFWALWWLSTIVEFIYKPLPIDPPLFRRRADWFRQNRAFKIDKAVRELGYHPKVDLSTGLRRTYEWYKKNHYLD